MNLKISDYLASSQPFIDNTSHETKRVIFATRTGQIKEIKDSEWVLMNSGLINRLPEMLQTMLIEMEALVPEMEDELQLVLSRNNQAIANDQVLSIVIQPTAFCQLGCDYCGQSHSPQWLNKDLQEKILARAERKLSSGRFKRFNISWFGSEPLSGINVMRVLSPKLIDLAKKYNCTYDSSIVTNGVAMLKEISLELIEIHKVISFNITLDGLPEYHDSRRNFKKSKKGTFEKIFSNVLSLVQVAPANIEIKIRTNVDSRNYEGVSPLIKYIADHGIQKKIKYYCVPVYSWSNDAHEKSLTPETFAELEMVWFIEMMKLGYTVGLIPKLKRIVCMAVTPQSEVIDSKGNIFNCTEISYVPLYEKTGMYRIGTLAGEETPQNRQALGNFNDDIANNTLPCSTCNMLPVCGGGCPKSWYDGFEPCPSAKNNINSRLMLHASMTRMQLEKDEIVVT